MGQLKFGQGLLIVCCIFYLIWWAVAFHPSQGDGHTSGKNGILLIITAVFGLAGLAMTMLGIINKPPANGFATRTGLVSGITIIAVGVIAYVVLLLGSKVLLHRMVTSELFLIVGWTMLEIAAINRAFTKSGVSYQNAKLFIAIVAVAAVLSLFFYLQYYRVKPMTGYIFGMIPLVTEAATMVVFELIVR